MTNRRVIRRALITAVGIAPFAGALVLAGTASAAFSDARLKKAIRRI